MNFIKFYQNMLIRRPYLTQAIQTAALMGTGDFLSQTLIERRRLKEVDPSRVARFSTIGFFAAGPGLRMWYGILHKTVGSSKSSKFGIVIKKVLLDQVIFAPVFLCFLFVAIAALRSGMDVDAMKANLQDNYFDVLKTNYAIWPWVQLVNFYYVPLQYQVLLVQSVALFWNMYLAWKTNRENSVTKHTISSISN